MTAFPRRASSGLALFLAVASGCRQDPTRRIPSIPVTVALVEKRDVPVIIAATGTVEPIRSVQVRAQVDGVVTRVAFREGDDVAQGQVLFQIDPRPYQADLEKTTAALARDQAQAAQATRDLARLQELGKKEYVTAQQVDQAQATVAQLTATLRADSAAVDQSRLNLSYATVRAAIGGRTGSVLVREGNLVRAAASLPLVLINQLAPIRVRFSLPAADLARVRARATKTLPVTAIPVGDSTAAIVGTLAFLDNAVDTLTGTIGLKAEFANRNHVLWPGELVRVRLELDTERGATVVPQAAVLNGQQGSTVFIVSDSNRVSVRKVSVLWSNDSIAVLAKGVVEPGEKIVTDGQLRLTDGAIAAIKGKDSAGALQGAKP